MIEKDCYCCKHRSTIPGDAHSRCNHPEIKGILDDPLLNIAANFASVGRTMPIWNNKAIQKRFEIRGNVYGISRGWFNWPWNFDPIWLENCNAWEQKK